MKIGTETIRGVKFEIHVTDDGTFTCTSVEGDALRSKTLEGLKQLILKHSKNKQKNVKIPFVVWQHDHRDKGKVVHGICVGIHGGNGNLLLKYEGGKTEQESYRHNTYIDPEYAAELERLARIAEAATTAYEEFERKHALQLKEMVAKILGTEEES